MKRSTRMELAQQTVQILERGHYVSPSGRQVGVSESLRRCLEDTTHLRPHETAKLSKRVLAEPAKFESTRIEVANETTLQGIARLLQEKSSPVAALNFASAKNPGGGFLNGSQAQEESLARSSALYASLMRAWDFYESHRSMPTLLYSDAIIWSPECPIFRNDEGTLLDEPLHASFITSPAPNAGAAATNRPHELDEIPEVFRRRSEYVLAVAAAHGITRLVLGAWGCGVFRNDPQVVANAFAGHLRGIWSGRFENVVFSVLDSSADLGTLGAFQAAFAC